MPQVGELSVLFTGNDARLTAVTKHAHQTLSRFAGQARGLLATAGLAIGLAGVTTAIRSFVRAAAEQEVAEKKLETALGRTSQALLDQAEALQKVTTASDDQIISAQAAIAAFTSNEDTIKRLTKSALDFAAAQGIDVVSAAKLLAKTLGSDMNALGRYGIQVEGAAKSTQRLEAIVRGVSTLFGGQAAAGAETFAGRVAVLKNKFGEVAEDLGRKIIPALERLLVMLDENAEKIGKYAGALIDFVTGHAGAIAGVTALTVALRLFGVSLVTAGGWLVKFGKALGLLRLTPMGLAITALGLAVAGLVNELSKGPVAADKFTDAMSESAARITGDVSKIQDAQAKVFDLFRELNNAGKDAAAAKTANDRVEAIKREIKAMDELVKASEAHDLARAQKLADQKEAKFQDENNKSWLSRLVPAVWLARKIPNLTPTVARQSPESADFIKRRAAFQAELAKAQARVPVEKIETRREAGAKNIAEAFSKIVTNAREAKGEAGKLFGTIFDGLKKFLEAREDLFRKVRMFGVDGLDAAIESIKQQRDELMKEAAKLGQLSPALAAEINAKANKQIVKETKQANDAFQGKLAGFGGTPEQQNAQAIQQVIQERDALIEEAKGLGLLTDAMRNQINAGAERAAAAAIKPKATPQFVGIEDAWKKLQESIFESEAQKEALMLARQQLAAAQGAAKNQEKIAVDAKRTADGVDQLVIAYKSQGVFN